MKALVTGSKGFVGRHMVEALKRRAYEVEGWDLPYDMRVQLHHRQKYDLVVHCAYRVGGRKEIDESRTNLAYNLALDLSLFKWAEIAKPGRILYYSSSAMYPVFLQKAVCWQPLHEIVATQCYDPDADYGWAKLMGERLAVNYAAGGGVVHVVRPFSGYGKDQSLDYPFPKFVERAKMKLSPFEMWGDQSSVRDWIHIDDVVGASMAVIDQDYRAPVNICTGVGTSMKTLAELCMKEAGYTADIVSIPGPMGVHTRVGNPASMKAIYKPTITIEEGVKRAFQ